MRHSPTSRGPAAVLRRHLVQHTGAILLLATLSACAQPDATAPVASADKGASTQRPVEAVLAEVMARHPVPGMAAAVMRDGGIVLQGALGVRRVGDDAPVRVTDRFHLGSNVKAMTSTMIATLVEEARLSWNSTPADVFPELASSMDPVLRQVTLLQLLEHRAGVPAFVDASEIIALPTFPGTPAQQRAAFSAYVLQRPPAVPVGTYLYSNAGYAIAASMAERVTGQSWEALIQDRVLQPLGMEASRGWPAASDPNQPWGHIPAGSTFVPDDPNGEFQFPDIVAPAGDLSLSLQDYAQFVTLHLRAARGHPWLLSADSFRTLQTPDGFYAAGWVVGSVAGTTFIGHEGSAGTFEALVLVVPSRNVAVAVFVNAGGDEAVLAAEETAYTLAGVHP